MEDGSGGRSRRYETNGSPAGLTLGGILSIKQTPPYRIHARTLLDLIRDDQTCGKESKKSWKMFREKLRLKLSGSVCTTTGPTLASHVHITTDSNRMPTRSVSVSVSVSPPVNNTISVPDTQTVNLQTEMPMTVEEHVQPLTDENRVAGGDGGEPEPTPTAVRMSLMSLLEVEASAYLNDDDDNDDKEEKVEGDDDVAVEDGGSGGSYNNCCVCMVRHKGAAFIPCGHTFCRLCSRELFVKRANCPLCNNLIVEILDIF